MKKKKKMSRDDIAQANKEYAEQLEEEYQAKIREYEQENERLIEDS